MSSQITKSIAQRRPALFFPLDAAHQAGALWADDLMLQKDRVIAYPNARGGVVMAPMTGTAKLTFAIIPMDTPDGRPKGKQQVCYLTIQSNNWETTLGPIQMASGTFECMVSGGQVLGRAASSQFTWGVTVDGTALDPASVAVMLISPDKDLAVSGREDPRGVYNRPSPPWLTPAKTPAERCIEARVYLILETDRLAGLEERQEKMEARKEEDDRWDSMDDTSLAAVDHAIEGVQKKRALLDKKAEACQAKTSFGEYLVALDKAYLAQRIFNEKAATTPYPLSVMDKDQLDALAYLKQQTGEDAISWGDASERLSLNP